MNEINVNIISMTMMSHILITKMIQRSKRSAIINISSFSAEHPIPYIANYSATKAYNDFFSQAI
jgi:17beta-estradiol 17-dehydrogenase / very-long-chain 3-oxoacyl-CoA reductase